MLQIDAKHATPFHNLNTNLTTLLVPLTPLTSTPRRSPANLSCNPRPRLPLFRPLSDRAPTRRPRHRPIQTNKLLRPQKQHLQPILRENRLGLVHSRLRLAPPRIPSLRGARKAPSSSVSAVRARNGRLVRDDAVVLWTGHHRSQLCGYRWEMRECACGAA